MFVLESHAQAQEGAPRRRKGTASDFIGLAASMGLNIMEKKGGRSQ